MTADTHLSSSYVMSTLWKKIYMARNLELGVQAFYLKQLFLKEKRSTLKMTVPLRCGLHRR